MKVDVLPVLSVEIRIKNTISAQFVNKNIKKSFF